MRTRFGGGVNGSFRQLNLGGWGTVLIFFASHVGMSIAMNRTKEVSTGAVKSV
jgi:hypothetical protein